MKDIGDIGMAVDDDDVLTGFDLRVDILVAKQNRENYSFLSLSCDMIQFLPFQGLNFEKCKELFCYENVTFKV